MKPRVLCPHCKGKLEQGQRIHPDCVDGWAQEQEAKAKRKAEKQAKAAISAEKKDRAIRLRAMRPIRAFVKDAQNAFNSWVRARDAGLPCVSCGEVSPPALGVGGQWDAGHYLSRGAYPEKRFFEDNVHKQCKTCNGGSSKNPAKELSVKNAYEIELIKRIGIDRYQKLMEPVTVKKLERDELVVIRDEYRAKLKELKVIYE